jgi:hypothetical protein
MKCFCSSLGRIAVLAVGAAATRWQPNHANHRQKTNYGAAKTQRSNRMHRTQGLSAPRPKYVLCGLPTADCWKYRLAGVRPTLFEYHRRKGF